MTNSIALFGFAVLCCTVGHSQPRPALRPLSTRRGTSLLRSTSEPAVRPATTTFFGDTGLWYVPTAEVLAHGKWSVSGYRARHELPIQGYTNVADFAGTFAFGIRDRAEIFGSFTRRHAHRPRPAAALRPTIRTSAASSIATRGSTRDGPATTSATSTVGAKINFCVGPPEPGGAGGARRWSKLPTGDKDAGVGTGKADVSSTSSSARKRSERSKCPVTAATNSAASRTASTRRPAHSVGASAPAFPSRNAALTGEFNGDGAERRHARPRRRPVVGN